MLETIRMFAHDKGWVNRLREAVDTGLTAEAAVERVQNDNRARMMRTPDPYLRERMHDLDDLSNRLLRILTGAIATASRSDLPQNAIVVARNMGPAELLDYDRTQTARRHSGGRRQDQPCGDRGAGAWHSRRGPGRRASSISSIPEAPIIVDGGTGEVFVRPSHDLQKAYAEKVRFYARKQAQYAALRDVPAVYQGRRARSSSTSMPA